jgi:hypothetical protein
MALPSVKLIRPSALQVGADERFVLEIHIPITFPHHLDSSLPAPPYHAGTVSTWDFRNYHALPLFRGLIAQIMSHIVGSQHADVVSELQFEITTRSSEPLRLFATWEASAVFDKNDFDFEGGYWRDKHGEEHRGAIEAFEEVWDRIIIYHAFVLQLVCGAGDAESWRQMNPRVLRLDVVSSQDGETAEDSDTVVVFEVREYAERSRGRVNAEVARSMSGWDAPEC